MRTPVIDPRSLEDLLRQLRERVPFYTPEWRAEEGDPATAVMNIFAQMHQGILQRLNKTADKHYIAFLNMLGVKLIPARQAKVPVTFYLSAGAVEPVLIPGGTQLSAVDPEGQTPVHFETERHLLAVPAKLRDIYTVLPQQDAIYRAPVEWLAAYGTEAERPAPYIELFSGGDLQEHDLYIGDSILFDLTSESSIQIVMRGDPAFEVLKQEQLGQIRWQYWAETEQWMDLELREYSESVLLYKKDRLKLSERKIDGISGRWIRGRIPSELVHPFAEAKVHHLSVQTQNFGQAPDFAFANDVPLDLQDTAGFYPFGRMPRTYDTFYLADRQGFNKGAHASIRFVLDHDNPHGLPKEAVTAALSWEYWNGGGWLKLNGRFDHLHPQAINAGNTEREVQLEFHVPEDIEETRINGQQGYWIRARLVNGSYGSQEWDPQSSVLKNKYCAPIIKSMMLLSTNYMGTKGVEVVTSNNLTYRRLTDDLARNQGVPLYELLADSHRSLYLGFDRPPADGPVSLYFSLVDQEYPEDRRPYLSWEYYHRPGGIGTWSKLDVRDETRYLTQSGCLVFTGPADFAEETWFGRRGFWIRAVNGDDRFQPVGTAYPEIGIAPAPKLKGLYLNTTMALQSETVADETLGSGQGLPSSQFSMAKTPVFEESVYVNEIGVLSDSDRQALLKNGAYDIREELDETGLATAFWVKWLPVDQLIHAGPSDRCYEIDRTTGTVTFGDGKHGAVLPNGRDNVRISYRTGGGAAGNVGPNTVTTLRTSIAFVDRVLNPEAAVGGFDTELMEQALERGPYRIKHRNRAVTAADYEQLALEAAQGIVRVKCLPNRNDAGERQSGWVTVVLVPHSNEAGPTPAPELRRKVEAYLRLRASNLVTAPRHIKVIGPKYLEISVTAEIAADSFETIPFVEQEAVRRLKAYLHPLTGGADGKGWEFGKIPCLSDFFRLLERIPQADYVKQLNMVIRDPESGESVEITPDRDGEPEALPHILVYSGEHRVTVSAATQIVT